MKRIEIEGYEWDSDGSKDYHARERDICIAKALNNIMDYLENDLQKMVEKEIQNRFELLDIREKE